MNKGMKFILTAAGIALAAKVADKVIRQGGFADTQPDEYNYDPQTGESLKKDHACEPETVEVLFKDYKYDPQTGEPLEP